jgi:multiple sugar transport system ATP-binding protein
MRRIELRHVTKRFGRVVAVHDLTLVIDPGSFVTVLGPSGCGKTTVLRMIAGLEDPDDGEILIDGHPVFSQREGIYVPPARRGLGMVFQSYALWPHMTVFENVAFGLALARRPSTEVKTRVAEVLVSLQLAGLESRYPQEISGGQQQRVALARMLATSPDIFLLDEPLSNLDTRLRTDMRSELKRLHRDTGATIVYVTHDQLEDDGIGGNVHRSRCPRDRRRQVRRHGDGRDWQRARRRGGLPGWRAGRPAHDSSAQKRLRMLT